MLDRKTALEQLRQAGLRLTPQRRAVIEALVDDTTHPTADEVAQRVCGSMPGVSLSTVYKVLRELSELDLVRQVDVPGPTRFDPESAAHAHVVCDGCGDIFDAPLPPNVLSALVSSAGDRASVSRVDVVIHGRCSVCA